MRIGEFSRRLGVTPPTVRFYEDLGLIPRARRVSGSRLFDQNALDHLRAVLALKRVGFTLGEIRALLPPANDGRSREIWRQSAQAKLVNIDDQISALRAARSMLKQSLDCDCQGQADRCALISMVEEAKHDSPQ